MLPETIDFRSVAAVGGGLRDFLLWFTIWAPLVAVLEYATHRWIMHWANRMLDPQLAYLKNHGMHHLGENGGEYVDIPVKNCLLLTSPILLLLAAWGLAVGPLSAVLIPSVALLAWSFVYAYLWTRLHRAIHGTEQNWVQGTGCLFRFLRNHHLKHHVHAKMNYGTVFPVTDYLFFTWFIRKAVLASRLVLRGARITVNPSDKNST